MEKFINRAKELQFLEDQYNSSTSSFVVLYGRRRVGKTSLIAKFLSSHSDSLYFLATEESEKQNLEYFKNQVAEYVGNALLKMATVDWHTVFKTLLDYKTNSKKVIVIDEFQYIGVSNSAFPSILQKIWDTLLKDSGVMLILCGSLISLMQSQTLDYSSPLYGRRTGQIKLKQISFSHYNEFFQSKNQSELLEYYAITGGVPKYIESFTCHDDIYSAIQKNVLSSQSFLYEEPYFLLQKEVSEIGSYFSVIRAIAFGNRKLGDIASHLGIKQTSLTKYLKVLADLDLVEREVPVTEITPEKSKSGLYKITDNYVAFWFKFVYPYRSYLEKGESEFVLNQIKKSFVQNYVSYIYEDVCKEKMWELSVNGEFSCQPDRVGKYWGSKAGEVDIVAIDTAGESLILGECKYSNSQKGLSVLHDLQEKTPALLKLSNTKNVEYVIFSKSGFTKGLEDEAKNNSKIKLISML